MLSLSLSLLLLSLLLLFTPLGGFKVSEVFKGIVVIL